MLANKTVTVDRAKLVKILVANKEFTANVIYLNRQEQLVEQGVDSKGRILRSEYARGGEVYAPSTIRYKKKKSGVAAITDRVTLFDTGKSYRSFKVVTNGERIFVYANYIKAGVNILEMWGEDVLGLTNESIEKIKPIAAKILQAYFKKELADKLKLL